MPRSAPCNAPAKLPAGTKPAAPGANDELAGEDDPILNPPHKHTNLSVSQHLCAPHKLVFPASQCFLCFSSKAIEIPLFKLQWFYFTVWRTEGGQSHSCYS